MATAETILGQPLDRVDGRLKVTGRATYAADTRVKGALYGVIVGSTVASGKIKSLDTTAAENLSGVIAVFTHHNAPKLKSQEPQERPGVDPKVGEPLSPLQDNQIRSNGQPIALVIADTFERATAAAALVKATYQSELGVTSFAVAAKSAFPPSSPKSKDKDAKTKLNSVYERGDFRADFDRAEVKLERTYEQAAETHNPMELHATLAVWDGPKLTLYDKTQWVDNVQKQVALALDIASDDVRVISPFVGGGFGSGLRVWPHTLMAAFAARALRRPVKIVLTRAQMFTMVGYRPHCQQHVSIGASKTGQIAALEHRAIGQTSTYEEFAESALDCTRFMYACPSLRTEYRLAAMNVNSPTPMRGPGEATGMYALESAMDELAVELNLDPIQLRVLNHADQDPEKKLPFSSKSLKECYAQGAKRFGWERRNPQPRSMRDGDQLVGFGMASATWPAHRQKASAAAQLSADGTAVVRSASSDIGPGTYTSMTQIAAQTLGLPLAKVRFELGDTRLPKAPAQGGSMTMASVGSAVYEVCQKLIKRLWELAKDAPDSPLHQSAAADIVARDGRLSLKGKPQQGEALTAILKRSGQESLAVTHDSEPGADAKKFSMYAFGAHFVEVRVDPDLAVVRIARMVTALAAGKIINPKTAHSQAIGGMVGGVGMALREGTRWDSRNGRVINANLADYLIPVHADIPALEAFYVDETDAHTNPLGTKGLAELSIVGVAAAVANAIYHATGKRLRELPISLEKLFYRFGEVARE
ncbi:MAG TPA: xanthine dehydrogenase family protein molybdopterin-binding subunit [Pirellulales bacterium]|jgi:xanthine dehydrogenase YagR molybdenum-binding subunit|nr:xanthine dehydrogenase family protein molybdopterin-binding subunit [Pirellulales bacterium]